MKTNIKTISTLLIALAIATLSIANHSGSRPRGHNKPLLIVSPSNLGSVNGGASFTFRLRAKGGSHPYRWQKTFGTPAANVIVTPDGLVTGTAPNPPKGVIVPILWGVTVTDSAGHLVSKSFTYTIVSQ